MNRSTNFQVSYHFGNLRMSAFFQEGGGLARRSPPSWRACLGSSLTDLWDRTTLGQSAIIKSIFKIEAPDWKTKYHLIFLVIYWLIAIPFVIIISNQSVSFQLETWHQKVDQHSRWKLTFRCQLLIFDTFCIEHIIFTY